LRLFPSDALLRLSVAAGWNQTEEDWRRLLLFAPDFCWGITADGQLVSSITAYTHPGGWAWVGMVLTLPEYRGRGYARHLLKFLLAQLDAAGYRSIGLDATHLGQPLYEQLGFAAAEPVERWARPGIPMEANAPRRFAAPGGQLYLRPGYIANQLGPFFAHDIQGAEQLLKQVPEHWSLYWDLFLAHPLAPSLAQAAGLEPARRLLRMWRGPALPVVPAHQLALSGFEYGC
jgi:GNAT superfamily N-acetyltransferase